MSRVTAWAGLALAVATGGCHRPSPEPVVDWLKAQRGGFCLDQFPKTVPLCASDAQEWRFRNPSELGLMCFENRGTGRARLRRTYPEGLTLDVGVHHLGGRNGHFLTLGSSDALHVTCRPDVAVTRFVLGVDASGRLFADAAGAPRITGAPLSVGPHLLTLRVRPDAVWLYRDGVEVGHVVRDSAALPAFPERFSPAFVLGAGNQRWWGCSNPRDARWLKSAPFLVHLRDRADPPWSLASSTRPSGATVILFTPGGVKRSRWTPSFGVGGERWQPGSPQLGVAHAFNARWVDDVEQDCGR